MVIELVEVGAAVREFRGGLEAGGESARLGLALVERDRMTGLREPQREGEAEGAATEDGGTLPGIHSEERTASRPRS